MAAGSKLSLIWSGIMVLASWVATPIYDGEAVNPGMAINENYRLRPCRSYFSCRNGDGDHFGVSVP